MSIDHQATLEKGLKMKIKRTKTGTKTSDSKHEIVKSEQNGNVNSDEVASLINSKKPANPLGVPASPSSSANKRGNNSHRKDKVGAQLMKSTFGLTDEFLLQTKDKLLTKEKLENHPLMQQETLCSCGSEKVGSLGCNNTNCMKYRDLALPPRVSTQSQMSLK